MNNLVKLSFDSSAQQAFLGGLASDSTGTWTPSRTRLFRKSLEARIADPKISRSVKNNAQKALEAMEKAEKGKYSLGKAQFNNLRRIFQFDAPGKITPDSPQYRRYAIKREAPGKPVADHVSDKWGNREYEINRGRAERRPLGARGKESYALEKMLFEEDAIANRQAQIENSKARHQKSIDKQRRRAAKLKSRDSVKAQQSTAPVQQSTAQTKTPAPTQTSSEYKPKEINKRSKVKSKHVEAPKTDPHKIKAGKQYAQPTPSLKYEQSYAERPKQTYKGKSPEFKPQRKVAPSGSVNVNKAIENTVAKVKALPSKAGRAASEALSDAAVKAIDTGGQPYYGDTGNRLRQGRQRLLGAIDSAVAKGTAKGKDALKAVGELDSALTGAGKQKAKDLKIGGQMAYEETSKNLKQGRHRLLGAIAKGKQKAEGLGKGLAGIGKQKAQDLKIGLALAMEPNTKAPSTKPQVKSPQLRKRIIKKRLNAPPAKAPVNVAPPAKAPVNVAPPVKAPVNVAPPVKSLPASAKGGTKALAKVPYGKYGLGGLLALGTGYAVQKGYKALKSKKQKKVSSEHMSNGMPKTAVQTLLKTASAKLIEQERELEQLRQWYNEAQVLTKAASVADRMVATGHLDYSDRDDKAIELASSPERLPIVEEAINMMSNPSAFSVASISDEYGEPRNARTQLESYLLGN